MAPSLIGDAAFIAGDATVEESVIGSGCSGGGRRRRVAARCCCRVRSCTPAPTVDHSIIGEGAVIGDRRRRARAHGRAGPRPRSEDRRVDRRRPASPPRRRPRAESRVRALVTGGAGFIGSTLVDRLLAEGHAVDVVDDLSTGSLTNLAEARAAKDADFTFHRIDIRTADVTELIERRRPEVVFHLAAQMDVRVSVERPVFDAETNIIGSLNVLEGARQRRLPQGGVRLERRHDLRRPGSGRAARCGRRIPSSRCRPTGWLEEGGGRLPGRLSPAARPRVHGAGAGQRLRAAAEPPRRGGRGRHLRPAAARRGVVHDLRGRFVDA